MWIERLRESFEIYDIVRIDHFRGFESYWEVPAESDTAATGHWVKGPGNYLPQWLALGDLNIIAEDLARRRMKSLNCVSELAPRYEDSAIRFQSR